ncbi:hypothetical protein OBBRIDRAFT_728200, partial [Obba rivulosa]
MEFHSLFSKPSADVIFVSSDNVAFRVHKIILAEASEFFDVMFSLPQTAPLPSQSNSANIEWAELDKLPLVRVTEKSHVLENLFRLCYPIDDPVLTDLGAVGDTLEAAIKYELREAMKILEERLMALVDTDPLRVYAIACRYYLESLAAAAAAAILKAAIDITHIDEMVHVNAGAYHRLLSY